ncbi:MAG: hypothetical protein JWN04_2261 [Myxococcaceae bacterium]|nr:hypothetical protein [Myxococcaceae bacterium]
MICTRVWSLSPLPAAALALMLLGAACDTASGSAVEVEKLPDIKPNLPAVPTLPPPPYAVQYPDSSYSLFGLRKRIKTTMDTDVELTAYVVETYVPPECPEGKNCPPARAPHVYLADAKSETDPAKRILLVGYAENQIAIDEAIIAKKKGKYKPPDPESGILPIPTDLFPDAKVKVKARFARVSGSGFAQSDGLLDYRAHTTIEPPAVVPEPKPAAKPSKGKKKKK